MVQPRESEWFGFYAPGQDIDVLPLNQTALYTEARTWAAPVGSLGVCVIQTAAALSPRTPSLVFICCVLLAGLAWSEGDGRGREARLYVCLRIVVRRSLLSGSSTAYTLLISLSPSLLNTGS